MSEDREYTSLEQIPAGPFQQARVALLAEYRLVDLAGTLFLDHVGFDQFVADPHAEAGDRSVLRQREVEDPFQTRIRVVDERLFNRRAGNLVADFDSDFVIADGQRLVAAPACLW